MSAETFVEESKEIEESSNKCRWSPTSMAALQAAEKKVLSFLTKPYRGWFVNIGNKIGEKDDNKIWTIAMNEKGQNMPLVLVHGFAAGVAFWTLNMEEVSASRPVYAFDLLGFGRSSRPDFNSDYNVAEMELVESMEDWRKQVGLPKFILLGHSFGGFLSASYALRYPQRVEHLILADPWGMPEPPSHQELQSRVPAWIRGIASILSYFNPLAGLRAAGPWGPALVGRLRSDILKKFSTLIEDKEIIADYIYHCNAQTPSGEVAFKAMTKSFGWAKNPMMSRIIENKENVPMTFICGARSWIDRQSAFDIQESRPDCQINVEVISGAGHHVYADQPEHFNELVNRACRLASREFVSEKEREISPDSGYSEISDTSSPATTPQATEAR